jgi:hypothetical protein
MDDVVGKIEEQENVTVNILCDDGHKEPKCEMILSCVEWYT